MNYPRETSLAIKLDTPPLLLLLLLFSDHLILMISAAAAAARWKQSKAKPGGRQAGTVEKEKKEIS